MSFTIKSVEDYDLESVDRFLRSCFPATKCDFLRDYGAWRHQGNQNRYVVMDCGGVVGYFSSIPGNIRIGNDVLGARWWMDLFVPPEHRGRGIQRVTDEFAKSLPGLHLGFPNHLAARIHQKHGWGVRSDLAVMMFPLDPLRLKQVRRSTGVRGVFLRCGAHVASPLVSWVKRGILASDSSMHGDRVSGRNLSIDCWPLGSSNLATTERTKDWLEWRFLHSPFRGEYSFCATETEDGESLGAVTRTFTRDGTTYVRILDLMGRIDDLRAVARLTRAVISDAVAIEATAVTILAGHRRLQRALFRAGFLLQASTRLRWWSTEREHCDALAGAKCHFSLADSDNDTVD